MKLIAAAVALSLFSYASHAEPLPKEAKAGDLLQLASLIRSQYGPYELKRQTLKINLDELVANYAKEAETLSNLDYYYLLNRFVAEFKDSHFRARLHTNHVSALGFVTDRIEGKALLDTIDRRVLPPAKFPFRAGDEVVAIGGKPVLDIVKDLARYLGNGYEDTSLRLATFLLGSRSASLVPPQFGKTTVTVKRAEGGEEATVELTWRQSGDPVEEGPANWGTTGVGRPDYLTLAIDDVMAEFPKLEKGYMCSGLTRVNVPDDAEILIAKPFVAYVHGTPKGKIGYLRIPHYSWPASERELRLKQYEWAVQQLEKRTVGLVIDQTHNCGGSVTFLEEMLKLFVTKPFEGVKFQFLASRNEYLQFRSFMTAEERLSTVEGESFTRVLDLIKTSWQGGKRMTPPTTFQGGGILQPNPVHYTKPILVLIDEMSGSGGDAFPAMMQGLGRAKLFGQRTMGAGGHVVEAAPLNYSGNVVNLTKSLFFHPNGTPIENHGATADIAYQPTREDFLNDYVPYQKAYLEALGKLIDAAKPVP